MAEAPAWAAALVAQVCADADVPLPVLRWRSRRDRPTSSGVTRRPARGPVRGTARGAAGSVAIVAGSDELDQRLTVLHELAHWVVPASPARRRRDRARHHDARFYALAFDLYRRHGIPDEVVLRGEGARYPSSLQHARLLRVPGAEEAWRRHRDGLRERAKSRPPLRVLVPDHRVRLVRDGRWTRCSVCGVRVVGPVLRRLRRRGGSHVLLSRS